MDRYRIILADKHAPLRKELRRMLDERSDLQITAETGEAAELLRLLSFGVGPHMVVLDSSLPDLQGTEGIRKVKAVHPYMKVLILSIDEDLEYLGQALANGAEGFVIKENVDEELLQAIETIRQGKVYVPRTLASLIPWWPPTNPLERR